MKSNVQLQNTPVYLGNIASRLIGICLTHTTLHIHSSTDSGGSLQDKQKTYFREFFPIWCWGFYILGEKGVKSQYARPPPQKKCAEAHMVTCLGVKALSWGHLLPGLRRLRWWHPPPHRCWCLDGDHGQQMHNFRRSTSKSLSWPLLPLLFLREILHCSIVVAAALH